MAKTIHIGSVPITIQAIIFRSRIAPSDLYYRQVPPEDIERIVTSFFNLINSSSRE